MIRLLFLMPSTFGAVTFLLAYLLYLLNFINYDETSVELNLVCITVILAYAIACAVFFRTYNTIAKGLANDGSYTDRGSIVHSVVFIAALHAVGLLGIGDYVLNLIGYFGSPAALALKLATASYEVRLASEYTASIGTQLSYFGWLAIWLAISRHGSRRGQLLLIALSVVQFGANLVYVDRTRPMWILFVGALLLLLKRYSQLSSRIVVRLGVVSALSAITLFIVVGLWVGKIDSVEAQVSIARQAEVVFEPVYEYVTGGFAYLNRLIVEETPAGSLERSLYPMFVVLSRMGATDPPPSQVNDFLLVPNPTNVGTFLEPLYRDGGVILMLIGIFVHAFVFNWLGASFLHRGSSLAMVGWGVLCFVNAIGFFTPKFNNLPTWIFLILGVLALIGPTRPYQKPGTGSS